MVPGVGLEPTQTKGLQHLKCRASTNFATPALLISTTMSRFETVAIWTKNPQVLQTIIVPVSIDMVKLKW